MNSKLENEFLFLKSIEKLISDYNDENFSIEKISFHSEKLFQIWKNLPIETINNEGFRVVQYVEEILINQNQHNDKIFILILSTLAKNKEFFQLVLIDYKRFQRLFASSTIKPSCLMRFDISFEIFFFSNEIFNLDMLNLFIFIVQNL